MLTSIILLSFILFIAGHDMNAIRSLRDAFQNLPRTDKLTFVDQFSNLIVELYPSRKCIEILTARGQVYMTLDMLLYALSDGLLAATFDPSDITSHLLVIDSLASMLMFDDARNHISWMKTSPRTQGKFEVIMKDLGVEEILTRKEKEFKRVTPQFIPSPHKF